MSEKREELKMRMLLLPLLAVIMLGGCDNQSVDDCAFAGAWLCEGFDEDGDGIPDARIDTATAFAAYEGECVGDGASDTKETAFVNAYKAEGCTPPKKYR